MCKRRGSRLLPCLDHEGGDDAVELGSVVAEALGPLADANKLFAAPKQVTWQRVEEEEKRQQ